MKELSPLMAAELADGVYAVQDEFQLKFFLSKPIFSGSPQQKQSLKATVGTRLINTKDAFGVVARGGAAHANDLFLMFRW